MALNLFFEAFEPQIDYTELPGLKNSLKIIEAKLVSLCFFVIFQCEFQWAIEANLDSKKLTGKYWVHWESILCSIWFRKIGI